MAKEKESISIIILGISIRTFINIMLLFVLVEGFSGAYYFSYKVFTDVPYKAATSETCDITIESGADAMEVASTLEQKGIVESRYLFLARVYLGKYNTRIKAGTYKLSPGMSPDDICRTICGIQSEDAS